MMFNEISLRGVDALTLLKKVLIVSLAGACLALVFEPDYTSKLPILTAFSVWTTHILFSAILFLASMWTIQRVGFHGVTLVVISILLLPFLFAPVSLLLDYGFGSSDEEFQSLVTPVAVYLDELVAVAPVALAVAIVIVFMLYREAPINKDNFEPTTSSPEIPIDTLPSLFGDDIIRVHAQDHYVEVVTVKGSTFHSEQFGDCVEKLKSLDGVQCHRSHWIMLSHIQNLRRSGSAYSCCLSNGDVVPVSRRRYSELKKRLGPRVNH